MNLDFNNMDDEQFQKEFIKFLTLHQSSIKNLIESNKKNNPFNSKNNFDVDEDYIKRIFNNIHSNLNLNNDEEWERKYFTDPNGKEDFSSFSRSGFYNPFDGTVRFNEKQQEMGTLELLDIKLKESIMNEDYENSAKIRDLINSLKEDENKNPK
jgi:hypothetical protein